MKEKMEEMEMFRDKLEELFKDILPEVQLRVSELGGFKGFEIANDQSLMKDSDYEVDTKQSLLHFTKVSSASQIIKNGFFRCSEFKDFEDIKEFNYALEVFKNDFKIDNTYYNLESKNHFALSSVLYLNEGSYLNDNLWTNYGDSHKGVCIKYKLDSPYKINAMIGKVQYGDVGLQKIIKLKDKLFNFIKENPNYIIPNIGYCLSDLLVFHKAQDYSKEDEVRIYLKLKDTDKNDSDCMHTPFIKEFADIGYYKELVNNGIGGLEYRNYFKIFLMERNFLVKNDIEECYNASKKQLSQNILEKEYTEYFRFYPTIKIEEIILGPELSPEDKLKAFNTFQYYKNVYGYDYKIMHILKDNSIRPYP